MGALVSMGMGMGRWGRGFEPSDLRLGQVGRIEIRRTVPGPCPLTYSYPFIHSHDVPHILIDTRIHASTPLSRYRIPTRTSRRGLEACNRTDLEANARTTI